MMLKLTLRDWFVGQAQVPIDKYGHVLGYDDGVIERLTGFKLPKEPPIFSSDKRWEEYHSGRLAWEIKVVAALKGMMADAQINERPLNMTTKSATTPEDHEREVFTCGFCGKKECHPSKEHMGDVSQQDHECYDCWAKRQEAAQ